MTELSAEEKQLLEKIHEEHNSLLSPYACKDSDSNRAHPRKYGHDFIRSPFAIDIDKIIHNAFFNRANDKTQVFSFYKNDDLTRRAAHVQLVSRISREIGKALRLNVDLIEAIAIGHDMGHTPFGHRGETFLNELYHANTNRFFNHNVHSVRVLQNITSSNLTLRTLDGILCHCGEKAFDKYEPNTLKSFEDFNEIVEECYTDRNKISTLRPSTLEGCVVRISDMIAYLGKDRQDAKKAKISTAIELSEIRNTEIIEILTTDIIANSIDKPYIALSDEAFDFLKDIHEENSALIYKSDEIAKPYDLVIKPMFEILYSNFVDDFEGDNYDSFLYQHYLNSSIAGNFYRNGSKSRKIDKDKHNAHEVVTDFIASMTDDYFIEIFKHLYPKSELNEQIKYVEYFDKRFC